eukprot:1147022-Pelagomonas_calceolata.AAC.2
MMQESQELMKWSRNGWSVLTIKKKSTEAVKAPHRSWEKEPHWFSIGWPHTTKFRLRRARQAEKGDRSSNENKSKMTAEGVQVHAFNNRVKHSQPASSLR